MAINVPALPLISSVRLKTDTFAGISISELYGTAEPCRIPVQKFA
jgi:hypothetical protein